MRHVQRPISHEIIFCDCGTTDYERALVGWKQGVGNDGAGGSVSDRTKQRQKKRFWILLALMYAVVFGMLTYARVIRLGQ